MPIDFWLRQLLSLPFHQKWYASFQKLVDKTRQRVLLTNAGLETDVPFLDDIWPALVGDSFIRFQHCGLAPLFFAMSQGTLGFG